MSKWFNTICIRYSEYTKTNIIYKFRILSSPSKTFNIIFFILFFSLWYKESFYTSFFEYRSLLFSCLNSLLRRLSRIICHYSIISIYSSSIMNYLITRKISFTLLCKFKSTIIHYNSGSIFLFF